MPDNDINAELDRIIALVQEADVVFDRYNRILRKEIIKARVAEDDDKVAELKKARSIARDALDEVDDKLAILLLANEIADHIEHKLTAKIAEATDLMDEMDNLGRTLDRIRQGAQLASGVLGIVSGIVA